MKRNGRGVARRCIEGKGEEEEWQEGKRGGEESQGQGCGGRKGAGRRTEREVAGGRGEAPLMKVIFLSFLPPSSSCLLPPASRCFSTNAPKSTIITPRGPHERIALHICTTSQPQTPDYINNANLNAAAKASERRNRQRNPEVAPCVARAIRGAGIRDGNANQGRRMGDARATQ